MCIRDRAKVFLAHMADQLQVDRWVGGVPDELRSALRRELDELAATDSVAMSPDGFGVHAMAAPVFDEYGVCASLALVATDDLLPLDPGSATADRLRNSARALSKAMGGDHGPQR